MIAKKLPITPQINVPLYPQPENWYNLTSNFLARWELPADVSGVSTHLGVWEQRYEAASRSEGIFDEKIFPAVSDGLWDMHVRFKNNVGWGPTGHYRLAIDTVPPLPFEITSADGLTTDNPTPTLQFKTSDGLSGLKEFIIRVDNNEPIVQTADTLVLAPQPPGKHFIHIKAFDQAGNIRENSVELEILPIASPVITSIVKNLVLGVDEARAEGTALAGATVLISLKDKNGNIVGQSEAAVDAAGGWQASFKESFKKGAYFFEVTAKDSRGALSLPVKSEIFKVKEKPLLVLGGVEITQLWFLLSLIIILAISFVIGWFTHRLGHKQVGRKVVIAERDVINAFNQVADELEKVEEAYDKKDGARFSATEAKFIINKIKGNLEKTRKYIVENIKEINE